VTARTAKRRSWLIKRLALTLVERSFIDADLLDAYEQGVPGSELLLDSTLEHEIVHWLDANSPGAMSPGEPGKAYERRSMAGMLVLIFFGAASLIADPVIADEGKAQTRDARETQAIAQAFLDARGLEDLLTVVAAPLQVTGLPLDTRLTMRGEAVVILDAERAAPSAALWFREIIQEGRTAKVVVEYPIKEMTVHAGLNKVRGRWVVKSLRAIVR
jgi:hypothetical protein